MVYTENIRLPSFKILLVFLCISLVGIFLINKLPVKLAPGRDLPTLSISFSAGSMQSRVVEMEVTSKLEGLLSRVKGVRNIYSNSYNGSGYITIELNKNIDISSARFEVATLIRQVYPSFPDEVSYPVLSAKRSDDNSRKPFLSYTVNAPASPVLIQQFAENNIKHKLAYLDGIDEISVSGATQMIWKLEYDIDIMNLHQISLGDIQSAIQLYLKKEELGMAKILDSEGNQNRIRIAIENEYDAFDISKIKITAVNGKIINLSQVVKASFIEEKPGSYFRINGLNTIYLSVYAREDANQLKLAENVKDLLKSIQSEFPSNYELHLSYDATEYITDQIKTIVFRSGLTILILISFLLIIYRKSRYLIMIIASLICSLAMSVVLYYIFKLELHLYSLMGITISLSLLIDNIIVMADQIIRQKNREAFLAILTATLTTMAALVIIFFMDEKIRLNLQDFALVIMINLGVSLLVVWLLVPALMVKLKIPDVTVKSLKNKRRVAKVNRFYKRFILFLSGKKALVFIVVLLMFGLPVFLLPSKIETTDDEELTLSAKVYNATLGSDFYQEKMKPVIDVALGGSLRLFVQKVYQGSYWKQNEETSIYVSLSMPNGTTLEQTNNLISKMEDFLKKFNEIKQFQTNVNTLSANIDIRFTKENQFGSFPFALKNELISKAIELGGGGWGVYGLGDGFNNNLAEYSGSYRIKLKGYNYDELFNWAYATRDTLMGYRRIKEVNIESDFTWYKRKYDEFYFNLRRDRLIEENITPQALFSSLNPVFGKDIYAGERVTRFRNEPIKLYSKLATEYDIWKLNNMPLKIGDKFIKIGNIADIEKYQAPQSIVRENQQYQLCLQYEYIGASEQGSRVQDRVINYINGQLPLGYSIIKENNEGWGDSKKSKQYLFLLIVIIIIYFTTSILFNSLKQPFAILLLIPVSYIGLFMTFYLFKLNFDQGGFAAFVLLSGITVNIGIYLINQYNIQLRNRKIKPIDNFVKAWNYRIVPIILTTISTILGFVPFLIGEKEGFWFPLAAGTIGGLVMSVVGILIFLPVFMGLKKRLF